MKLLVPFVLGIRAVIRCKAVNQTCFKSMSTLMAGNLQNEALSNSVARTNIHIVHAGERVQFLQDLSAELKKEFNQDDIRCQYEESYKQEENIAKKIEKDVKLCNENQNKSMIIVSQVFIDVLTKSPDQAENIQNFISESCEADSCPNGKNFVLLEIKENTIFSDPKFLPLKVYYENNDLKKVAETAVNIWREGNSAQSSGGMNKLAIAAGVVGASAVAGVTAVAIVPAALGFGAAGIASGSFAASMMSGSAIASGGGVAAGSAVAILQSAGATGLTMVSGAVGAGVGGAVGAVGTGLAAGVSKLKNWWNP